MKKVPHHLKTWFVIHFIIDLLIAIPLLLFPEATLTLFALPSEPIMARMVAAALIGIGGTSFLIRNKTKSQYDSLLTLKIIWSLSAILALSISIFQGSPKSLFIFVATFTIFFFVWTYYKAMN